MLYGVFGEMQSICQKVGMLLVVVVAMEMKMLLLIKMVLGIEDELIEAKKALSEALKRRLWRKREINCLKNLHVLRLKTGIHRCHFTRQCNRALGSQISFPEKYGGFC